MQNSKVMHKNLYILHSGPKQVDIMNPQGLRKKLPKNCCFMLFSIDALHTESIEL